MRATKYRLAVGSARPLPDSNEPPTEFPIWEYGETQFRWMNGEEHSVVLTPELAQRLFDRFAQAGRQLAIDYNHGSMNSYDPEEAKAAGWFELELREASGLWAVNVTWTEQAAGYLRRREYRYFSPTWADDDAGPLEIANLALTVNPATLQAFPLVASLSRPLTAPAVEASPQATGLEQPMLRIASALGLPEAAPETEIATRAASLRAFEATVLATLGTNDRETAVTQLESLSDDLQAASARVKELEHEAE